MTEWNVTRTPYNAPGLLIWHRDQSHSMNDLANNLFDPPSIGSKGTVLLVDAHYDPARLRGAAAAANPSLLTTSPRGSRPTTWPSAPVGRYPFRYCVPDPDGRRVRDRLQQFRQAQPGQAVHRRQDLVSGLGVPAGSRPEEPLFFRDVDASTVVPSKGNEIYSTRIVDRDGSAAAGAVTAPISAAATCSAPATRADGRPAIEGGDPGTTADLSLGVRIRVMNTNGKKNTKVRIAVRPGHQEGSTTLTKTGQR